LTKFLFLYRGKRKIFSFSNLKRKIYKELKMEQSIRKVLMGRILNLTGKGTLIDDAYRASLAFRHPADENYWRGFFVRFFVSEEIRNEMPLEKLAETYILPIDPRYPFIEPTGNKQRPRMSSWKILVKYLMEPPTKYEKYFRYLCFGAIHLIPGFLLEDGEEYDQSTAIFLFNVLNYNKDKWIRSVCAQGLIEIFHKGFLLMVLHHTPEYHILAEVVINPNPKIDDDPHKFYVYNPNDRGQKTAGDCMKDLLCNVVKDYALFDFGLIRNRELLTHIKKCNIEIILSSLIQSNELDVFRVIFNMIPDIRKYDKVGLGLRLYDEAIIYNRVDFIEYMNTKQLITDNKFIKYHQSAFTEKFLTPETKKVIII
jgi:hypothetical protein